MKPLVFLAHSKHDSQLVERLADDLRVARVNVWYDEWEIPPGRSFREHIFEDGIPNCDLVFVYLTPDSAKSYWVRRELDAAFIRDAEERGGFIALFADSDETRKLLPLELQALQSPLLNEQVYNRALCQLISIAWEGAAKRQLSSVRTEHELDTLRLEKRVSELEKQIAEMRMGEAADVGEVIESLKATVYTIGESKVSLLQVFRLFVDLLAVGATKEEIVRKVSHLPGTTLGYDNLVQAWYEASSGLYAHDFLGPLQVAGLTRHESRGRHATYCLTNLGTAAAKKLGIR